MERVSREQSAATKWRSYSFNRGGVGIGGGVGSLVDVAIFAGGPSLTREDVLKVLAAGWYSIAINNAWRLAPEADALVAVDPEWWREYPEARIEFAGEKITMRDDAPPGVAFVESVRIGPGSNSALQAAYLATRRGATRLLLLGVDLRDEELRHFDGLHKAPLVNPTVEAFKRARSAWEDFARRSDCPEVFNCSERSALTCFRKRSLADALS